MKTSRLKKLLRSIVWWVGITWAFPVTITQVCACLATGSSLMRFNRGVFELVSGSRGSYARFFKKRGFAGLTVGTCILYRSMKLASYPRLRAHEMRHVHQFMLFGPTMIVLYPLASLYALLTSGDAYSMNVFEIDASNHEMP